MDGEDETVGADYCAGAAPVRAEANCGRDVGRRDVRVNANGGAQNFVEQEGWCVHGDVLQIRLGTRTCGFKRERKRKKEAAPRETASDTKVEWYLLRLIHGRVGHRGFIRTNRERLQRLAEVKLAVLLIRVQFVEPLDGLVRTHVAHRELSRELMNNAAGSLPMKDVGGGIEHVKLADADTHRVGIAVDVTVFGGAVETVPETAIMAHVR